MMSEYSVSEQRTMICQMLQKIGLPAQDEAVCRLQSYYELLIEWNLVMNLTAITEFDDVAEKHFADSLLIADMVDLNRVRTVIDVGTGAGFPGIPLKILFPEIDVVLLDSLQKRIGFLNTVIAQLNLSGIRAVHGRAEDLGKDPEYRERFDLCVSRAVADLCVLSELCIPFVKPGGMFVSYKSAAAVGETIEAEHAIRVLGGGIPQIRRTQLPVSGQERLFVCVKKENQTPDKYPRRAGIPAKRPLCVK